MSAPRLQGAARALALEIAAEARAEWGYATDVIARAFRAHRELPSRDRRTIAETVYGLIRMDRRLDAIVDELVAASGAAPPAPLARDELTLLVYEAREGVPVEALASEARRLLRVEVDLAAALGDEAGLGKRAGLDREATRLSYPTWLVETWADQLGQTEALRLAEAMDEGSQLVAELVAPPPGGRILDACAGAGGKTLALGASLGGKGRVLALDTDGKKLEELRRRGRRAGLTNVEAKTVTDDLGSVARAVKGTFDRVLVDAPCSGLGTLRRNPEARWRLTRATVDSFPARQLALLVTYAPLTAVGGRLVYATCTVNRNENERVVERFLAERDDFVPVPVKEIWGRERAAPLGDGMTLRLTPQAHDTDGFFAAVLRRVR